ncbi:hypothetical protein GALMADRAFT_145198 [Galerina marginata CBS 339.88]|uniref:Uncharacterized protein n=1 Tax=Galerina marginata (strain CBS 339.88) TaxID=685588 RepID=A0A067SFX3_GALM3|nr:hypothetical protein GALMADRAFT_145198 [Galerina marginata CBS 339.88]
MSSRPPYQGPQRKLVLAFDVGTTFSGISYSILDPGEVPEIRGVTRYPAQEHVGGDSKIPTIVYYDKQGKVRAVGAEAMREGIEDQAEDEEWTKAEWQLHLRPKTQSAAHITEKIPPLPEGKAAIDIFADFLRYLHQCARTYIEETHAGGVELWKNLESRTDFVLTHPNGWEGGQQSLMRKAAVKAGLVPDTEGGHQRLSFVTEGEASLHFCIQSGLTNEAVKSGNGVLIVDAGGGTIDISAYKQTSQQVKSFEEMAAPLCHFQGSIFVTNNARTYLQNLLNGSRFLADVPYITRCFDKTTKLRFRNAEESQYIKFGTLRDKDPKLNIRSGQLKLNGSDVASFFEPSVQCIVKSIEEQSDASQTKIASVFLVGGFAASDWLFTKLKDTFASRGLNISRPDGHVNKVVADGAVSFYIDHFVASRVSKLAYGTEVYARFQPQNPDHILRSEKKFQDLTGDIVITGLFSTILPKNTKVAESQEFRKSYRQHAPDPSQFNSVEVDVMCYRGTVCLKEPAANWFMDKDSTMFSTLCRVEGDTSLVVVSPKVSRNRISTYYEIEFDIILSLGLTELKAQIAWIENGVEKRSPAQVVYDPEVVIRD